MIFNVGRGSRHPKGIRITERDPLECVHGNLNCPLCDAPKCTRCKINPVRVPGETSDGKPTIDARFCDTRIDRCHEATEFDHVCQICATPEEARYYGWAVATP